MKKIIRKIYKKCKKIPVLGSFLIFVRNIPNHGALLKYRLRKGDIEEARNVIKNLYHGKSAALEFLGNFKKNEIFKKKYSYGYSGDFDIIILYLLVRMARPDIVIETGIASGRSSSAILLALLENKKGKLYSIDLPRYYSASKPDNYITKEGNTELSGFIPEDKEPGWLVPNYLRERWNVILGDSNIELPKLLAKFDKIDMFYHDGDHSYETMSLEFNLIWQVLKDGGFIVSDDIKWNNAFFNFMSRINASYSHTYRNLGILKK